MPYEAGETLKQPDLARTLDRIADAGARRLLRRRDRHAARERNARARRPDHARGSQELHRCPPGGAHGNVPRLRSDRDAAALVRRRRPSRDAERARGVRPEGDGLRVRRPDSPDDRVDEARVRRPGEIPRRSRLQQGHADRSPDVQAVRRRPPQDDQPGQGGQIVTGDLRMAARERRDDAHLGRGREPQRGLDDLHPRAGLRREDRRARRRLPAEQRDGGLQRRAGDDDRQGARSGRSRISPNRTSGCSPA